MRRIALILITTIGGAVFAVSGPAIGGDPERRYWVELDNAFGLIEGGDVKVAGVRAGKI